MGTLSARSKDRFPTLAPPFCPWHDDCTAMDCENFRTFPKELVFGPLLADLIRTPKREEE